MHVAVLELRLHLPGASSLKEKRGIVKSLLERVRNRLPVAGAEVAELDRWQLAALGFATIGNEVAVLQRCLDQVVRMIEADGRGVVTDFRIEIIS